MRDVITVDSLDDPRVEPYRQMRERDLATRGDGGLFIAEGEQVVRRLLTSAFAVHSVLLAERRVAEIAPLVPSDVPVYAAPAHVVHGIVGFKFHSGVLAAGRRAPSPRLEDLVSTGDSPLTLVVCPEIANTENLGGLIRIAAAFGADAMLLGERSCDPFFRQSVRVSMGAVFSLPIVRARDIVRDLEWLRRERGVELIATVLDPAAEPLAATRRARRTGILFGNEAQGLAPGHVELCDRRVTIPMRLGTDSLNVMVAAGIVMHHFARCGRQE